MPSNRTTTLEACPFCGGKAERIDIEDGENAGGSCICCTVCNASGNLEFGFKENFVDAWNTRTDLSQASVAAALEAAANARWEGHVTDNSPKYLSNWQRGLVAGHQAMSKAIRALITPAQHDALQAAIDAAKAEARAEIYAQIEAMPRREELLGGQRTQYVQLDEVLAWIGAKP